MSLDARIGIAVDRFDLDLDLSVGDGEVVAVLGPNGSGKTTLLRTLAGLVGLDRGRLVLDGATLDDPAAGTFVPPEQRPVGVVFQDTLLFPHLSALDNVAFAPRASGRGRATARALARDWLERLDLADQAEARPRTLSGGQAQRVALARALAREPHVLLLDEPLSALDAGARAAVRRDLHRHLGAFDGATVLVTHDPLDALALADRIVILEDGRVTQTGTLAEVTTRPRSRYVADLVGVNLLTGEGSGTHVAIAGGPGGVSVADPCEGPVLVLVHPNSVVLHRREPEGSARNHWPVTISGFDLLGDRVRVRLTGEVPLVAEVTPAAVSDLGLIEGLGLWAAVKATDVTTYPI
jgi:molybdate transport system ATP-binding protein